MDWRLFALGSAFFAGLTALFGKLGVAAIPSNFATLIRTVFVVLVLLGLVGFRGEWAFSSLDRRSLLFLAISAVCTGASWLCYFHALQIGPVSRVAPIDKLSVVFAMALAFAFLGERPDWKTILGGLLITAGSLVIAL